MSRRWTRCARNAALLEEVIIAMERLARGQANAGVGRQPECPPCATRDPDAAVRREARRKRRCTRRCSGVVGPRIDCTESTRSRGRCVSRHQSQPLRHRRERASGADVIGAPNRRSNILRTAGTKEEPPVRKTIFTSADWTLAAPRRESTQCSIAATSSSIEPSKQDRCATAFISIDPSES